MIRNFKILPSGPPLPWRLHGDLHLPLPPPPPRTHVFLPQCALSKQGHRFLSSLATASAIDDPSETNRLIRKFVASSSKHIALNALSHLLSSKSNHPRLSSLALPLYMMISESSWFRWNPKLVADVIALLYKLERLNEARMLISETISKLECRERELCAFYCNLVDFHSQHKSKLGVFDSCENLKKLVSNSSSVYVHKQAYRSIISGLCSIDLPNEAENVMDGIGGLGFKPSVFEFRTLVYAYGRMRLFQDMNRIITRMESEGFRLDTVISNMILSSFGAHNELSEMVLWLQRMKESDIPFSIRTYNSVLNSCQEIMSMLQDPGAVPLSVRELLENLGSDEASLVLELIRCSVLGEAMEENSFELKLDLHGMHLGSAYLVMLQWFNELRSRFIVGKYVAPIKITVICGSGKHSIIRGESPVKDLVKEMIRRLQCPLRVDRKNIGCFVAKGRVLKNWFMENT